MPQEYQDCWTINQAGEFVDLSYMCLQKSGKNSGNLDNPRNSQKNPTRSLSNQNVTSLPKKGNVSIQIKNMHEVIFVAIALSGAPRRGIALPLKDLVAIDYKSLDYFINAVP